MYKAFVTVRILDKRLEAGEVEEFLRGITKDNIGGLYILGDVAFRISSQDAYEIGLEAYSDSLNSLLKAVKAIEDAFKARYNAIIEVELS